MSLPSLLVNGLDTADLFEVAAPLPWLMMATTEDYFRPEGARRVFEEARRFYEIYNASDRIQFFVGTGPHGTPLDSREQIYQWMIRWLADGKGDPSDQPVKLYTNLELQVTPSGNVDGEPHSRKLYEIIAEEFQSRRQKRGISELQAELRRLGVHAPAQTPSGSPVSQKTSGPFRIEELQFETEPGLPIAARLYIPTGSGRKPAVVILEEKRLPVPLYVQRSQSTAAIAEALASSGQIVMELDVRDSPAANDGRPFLGNWLTNERAELVGQNLAALRARDLLLSVNVLSARPDVNANEIRAYARGVKGVWLMLAATVDSRLQKIWLDRTPVSFASAFEGPLTNQLFDAMIPRFALHWDFADLVQAIGNHRILRTDPTNWMNRVIPLGQPYRYRYVGEGDGGSIEEFLKPIA